MYAGGWSVGVFGALAAGVFVVLDPVRATSVAFLFMPQFFELLPDFFHTLWYVGFGLLMVAWLKELALARRHAVAPAHYLVLYTAFVGALLLSVRTGVDWRDYHAEWFAPEVMWLALTPLLASLTPLALVAAIPGRRQLRTVAYGVVAGGLLHTPIVFVFTARGPVVQDLERYYGLFGGPHTAGIFEALYLLCALALLWTEPALARRRVLLGCAVMFLGALVVSGSRTTLLTLLLAGGLSALFHLPQVLRKMSAIHIYLAGSLFVIGLVVANSVYTITPGGGVGGVYGMTLNDRLALIRYGLELLRESPLTGVGIGRHVMVLQSWPLPGVHKINLIHTYYVTILVETGFLGFVPFMAIVGVATSHFLTSLARFRAKNDFEMYCLTGAFFLAFVIVLAILATQAATGERLFWALVGTALAARRISLLGEPR